REAADGLQALRLRRRGRRELQRAARRGRDRRGLGGTSLSPERRRGRTLPPFLCAPRPRAHQPIPLMPVTIVIGGQWGDEGKGKVVDLLAPEMDVVARYQGGANAGHTIAWEDQQFVLHLVPSGIFHEGTACVIGNGVVIDP